MSNEAKILCEGRFLSLLERDGWEYAERPNVTEIAAIVAVTDADELIFVEQFRVPLNAYAIELPAGLVGDHGGESLEDGANRELEEETGYRAQELELLTRMPSSSGLTSETVSLVLAKRLEKMGEGGGVDGEQIRVHLTPLREVDAWLKVRQDEGKFVDSKVWAGLHFLHRRGLL